MKVTLIIASILLIAGFAFAVNKTPVLQHDSSARHITAKPPVSPLTTWTLQYDDGTGEYNVGCGSADTRAGVLFTPPDFNGPMGNNGEIISVTYWLDAIYNSYPCELELWNTYWDVVPGGAGVTPDNSQAIPLPTSGVWTVNTLTPAWYVNDAFDFIVNLYRQSYSFYIAIDQSSPNQYRSYFESNVCNSGTIQNFRLIGSIGGGTFAGNWLFRIQVWDDLPVELFSFSATAN
jgi:hypothetical protein